jgi:hypothetical protein
MWGTGYISVTVKGEKPCVVTFFDPTGLKKCGIDLTFAAGDPRDTNPERSIGFCVRGTAEKPIESVIYVSQLKLRCTCPEGMATRRNWKTELMWTTGKGASGKERPNPDTPVLPPK